MAQSALPRRCPRCSTSISLSSSPCQRCGASLLVADQGSNLESGNDPARHPESEAPSERAIPLRSLPGRVVALAAGDYHSLALTDTGDLSAWGANDDGQLGLGATENCLTPTQVTAFPPELSGLTSERVARRFQARATGTAGRLRHGPAAGTRQRETAR